jgi:hypothetical protein
VLENNWLLPMIEVGFNLPACTYLRKVGSETSKNSAASSAEKVAF